MIRLEYDPDVWISLPPNLSSLSDEAFNEWFSVVHSVYRDEEASEDAVSELRRSIRCIEIAEVPQLVGVYMHADSPVDAPFVVVAACSEFSGDDDLLAFSGAFDNSFDRSPAVDHLVVSGFPDVVQVVGVVTRDGKNLETLVSISGARVGVLCQLIFSHRNPIVVDALLSDVQRLFSSWNVGD